MEDNLTTNPQVPVSPTPSQNVSGNNRLLIFAVVCIVLLVLVLGGAFVFLNSKTASLKNLGTVVKTNATPTPYVSNPNDTSNQAIDSDTQAAQNTLNSLNNDLNNADKSFNDQSVNLQ